MDIDTKDILQHLENSVSYQADKHWDNAFMFMPSFISSKQFARYKSKIEADAFKFFAESVEANSNEYRGLSDLMQNFFAFTVFGDETDPEDPREILDWRCNLIPFVDCTPGFIAETNEVIYKGWFTILEMREGWNKLYNMSLETACVYFVHDMYTRYAGIDDSNFCIKAMPCNTPDRMMFLKVLMNVIWINAWSVLEFKDQAHIEVQKERIVNLVNEKEQLRQEYQEYKDTAIADFNKRIAQIESEKQSEIQKGIDAYYVEVAETLSIERKKNKQLESELAILKTRYSELEEQFAILTESEDDGEKLPEESLTYNSKIVFISSPAYNGRFERDFEKLRQRLPNCKFAHRVEDITAGADCYVLLTHFMLHHSFYNSARDTLAKRNWPYLHSSSQNIDRIIYDIFNRTRYTEQ